jgi:hypothetical protein
MGGGKGGSDTQTVKQQPWGPAQDYLQGGNVGGSMQPIYSGGGQGAASRYPHSAQGAASRYPHSAQGSLRQPQIVGYEQQGGQQVPGVLPEAARLYQQGQGLSPMQQEGMVDLSGYAGGQLQDLTDSAMGGVDFLASGDVLSPDSNPYLQDMAAAYADQVNEQLQRTTLSGIDDQYTGAGGWGNSRQGIERGLARGEASEAIADQTSRMYSDAYNRGLSAMQSGLSMAPSIGQFGAMPGQMMQQIGGYPQQEAQSDLANYANIINQAASQGSQQVRPQSSGGLLGAIGGASAGAGLAGSLDFLSPGVGAGIGAIGGLLS